MNLQTHNSLIRLSSGRSSDLQPAIWARQEPPGCVRVRCRGASPRRSLPNWIFRALWIRFPKSNRDLKVDVVIIGGGITGITAAYLLKKAGHSVALIERAGCASIDTGHTTAHLTCVTDARLHELVDDFGKDRARAVWE